MNAQQALLDIQQTMDGVEWTPNTLEEVARIMTSAGYRIRDTDDTDPEPQEPPLVPETVHVHWSESPMFKEGHEYSFVGFETLALQAAVYKGGGGGYDKTEVTVRFTSGFTFGARLDLAMDDTHGFRHYVSRHLSWHRESGRESGDTTALFKRIRWPE